MSDSSCPTIINTKVMLPCPRMFGGNISLRNCHLCAHNFGVSDDEKTVECNHFNDTRTKDVTLDDVLDFIKTKLSDSPPTTVKEVKE